MTQSETVTTPATEGVVEVVHPSMWRSHPFLFLLLLLVIGTGVYGLMAGHPPLLENAATLEPWLSLALVVVPLVALGVWWITTRFHTLEITDRRSVYRRGLISRQTSEVLHEDIRNLKVDQNLLQRLLGVGDVGLSSAGQDDMEIVIRQVPHPDQLAGLIRERQA